MEKVKEAELDNVVFVCDDAERILEIFEESELDGMYLNFSDPWPKKRHAKRRLTYVAFLERYKTIIKEGGKIFFKTDNRPLFDFSLEEFEAFGLKLEFVTRDLHNSEMNEGNVMTEYETKFSEQGMPIYRVCAEYVR